jgi:uncharacterized OsmC-like protein
MVFSSPDLISRVRAEVRVSGDLTEEEMTRLLRSVKGCKVRNTLSHMPQIEISLSKSE